MASRVTSWGITFKKLIAGRRKKRLELRLPFVIISVLTHVFFDFFFFTNVERTCLTMSMILPRVCPALVLLFL